MSSIFWSMNYNPYFSHGWSFGAIHDDQQHRIDGRVFSRGERLTSKDGLVLPLYPFGQEKQPARPPLKIDIERAGRETSFTMADSGAPVLDEELADVFREEAREVVELIPVFVAGSPQMYFLLNVCALVNGIDHAASEIDYWPEGSPLGKAGKPIAVYSLKVDREAVAGYPCCRLLDWQVKLIVSDRIRQRVAALDAPELQFIPVTE